MYRNLGVVKVQGLGLRFEEEKWKLLLTRKMLHDLTVL